MPTVEVSFTALPAHVRTARLVALAVARRAGVDEQLLDEVRLPVGEACSRAGSIHQSRAADMPVMLQLTDEQDRFIVEVLDRGPIDEAMADAQLSDLDAESIAEPTGGSGDGVTDMLPPGFGLAVISGLVEDVTVTSDLEGTRVRMTWPANDAMAPDVN